MKAAYHLAFAVFSMGTVGTPTAAPNATHQAETTSAIQPHVISDAGRSMAADFSARLNAKQEGSSKADFDRAISIGESLPEAIELHPIPQHETYRYAVVQDHRVIVDASSRKVVYVIR